MKSFSMILASDDKNGIGKNNALAWKIKKDMKHFQKITVSTDNSEHMNAVIMGRKTWESIPEKFRPLPGRVNCVLTRNSHFQAQGAEVFQNLEMCLNELNNLETIENIFVIGGSHLYNSLLDHKLLERIYLTHVEGDYECDIFFEGVPNTFELRKISSKQEEDNIEYYFAEYEKKEA